MSAAPARHPDPNADGYPIRRLDRPCSPDPVEPQRRPRLLVCAARHGLADYRRERDLPRLLRGRPGDVLPLLEELEAEAEAQRRSGDHGWSCTRHVELLIALLAERMLRRA